MPMRLPNPNQGQPFQRVIKDSQGNDLYGIRAEHTPDEEIVHIPTQRSNQAYHRPETVLDPTGCEHSFVITSIGRREVECERCQLGTTFVPGVNYTEWEDGPRIVLGPRSYPVRL